MAFTLEYSAQNFYLHSRETPMCTIEEATHGAETVDEEKTEIYLLLTPSTIAARSRSR